MNKVIEIEDIVLTIEANVVKKMLNFLQDSVCKNESGGVLVGYYIDSFSFVITDISTPSERDKSSRYSFHRSAKAAQRFINECFKNSNGKKIYLGEWHTHPEEHPMPSGTDLCSYKKQLQLNQLNSPITFMLILGILSLYMGVYKGKEYAAFINSKFD